MTKPTDSKTSSSSQPAPQGKRFDETFKLDAVQLRERSGRPRAQVARDLGVSQVTLAAWETRYGAGGTGAGTRSAATSPGAGPAGTVAALAEVARLRAELEHMTLQRDILKKAMAIVSQEQRGALK
ncbi:MAG: transposase [Verrucomicrobiaceae bacterium]|nr:MAG: transposase [Verrucomicrobiaceae bacterium]